MADHIASRQRPRSARHRRHARVRQQRLAGCVLTAALVLGVAAWHQTTDRAGPGGGIAARDTSIPSAAAAGANPPASTADAVPATVAAAGPATTRAPTTTAAPRPTPITLAFAGDILTHMPLNEGAVAYGRSSGKAYDFGPMLAPMQPVLAGADLALCHLEVPIAPTPGRVHGYPSFGAPPELIAGIASAGYDGCSTASNHTLDQRFDGIEATLNTFDVHRLGHTGSARSAEEAATPRIYTVKGVRVAHLAYAYGFNGYRLPDGKPWAANLLDPNRILADAHAARAAGAQLVVVSLHWGTENVHDPDAQQRAVAPVLTASPDVDVVVGHHAHVVQPIEWVNGKPVVFGLGNQLSGQRQTDQRDGVTAVLTAAPTAGGRYRVTALKAVPTYMDTPTWRVLPITSAITDPATPPPLKAEMQASYVRSVVHLGASGPVPAVTVDPLPPG